MKKTNNKGFSLVELIIVIAIMAILIGVLAPQYIKYVEKSRKSADSSLVESCKTALQVAYTDEDYAIATFTGTVVTITKANGIQTTDAGVIQAYKDYFGDQYADKKFKSKTYATASVTLTVSGTDATGYKVTVVGDPVATE